jgi:hypothetical protein
MLSSNGPGLGGFCHSIATGSGIASRSGLWFRSPVLRSWLRQRREPLGLGWLASGQAPGLSQVLRRVGGAAVALGLCLGLLLISPPVGGVALLLLAGALIVLFPFL